MADKILSFSSFVLLAGLLAVPAAAQSVPPLPQEPAARAAPQPPAVSKDTPAQPTQAPASRAKLKGLKEDEDLQGRISDIDKLIENTWQQVEEARLAAQRFRIAKASLDDVIAGGDCAGAPSVSKRFDTLEGQHRKLEAALAEQCGQVSGPNNANLVRACADERAKLKADLDNVQQDRSRLARLCPAARAQ